MFLDRKRKSKKNYCNTNANKRKIEPITQAVILGRPEWGNISYG